MAGRVSVRCCRAEPLEVKPLEVGTIVSQAIASLAWRKKKNRLVGEKSPNPMRETQEENRETNENILAP